MSNFSLIIQHGAPKIPATQTISFGEKTRVGHGGHPLGYQGPGTLSITGGNASNHWQIDNRNMLVPKNGVGAYGTAGPTFSGPYTLTVTDGIASTSTVTVNIIANAAHQREMYSTPSGVNQDTATSFQLRTLLALIIGAPGAILLGDTIYGRDGIGNAPSVSALNQGGSSYRMGTPPVGGWATGSGGYSSNTRIKITSDTPNSGTDSNGNPIRGGLFVVGNLTLDGSVFLPWDFVNISFYFNQSTGGNSLVKYSTSGFGASAYACSFEYGPAVSDARINGLLSGFAINKGSTVTQCYFKRVYFGVGGGAAASADQANIITWNVFEKILSDAIHVGGVYLTIQYNFCFNVAGVPGNHPDFIQHTGFQDGLPHSNFGSIAYNIAVRNSAPTAGPGTADMQGIFLDDTTGAGRILDANINNNICLLTYANGVFLTRFDSPAVNLNTGLTDFGAGVGTNTFTFTVHTGAGGTGGSWSYNLANSISIASQAAPVTQTGNVIIAKTTPAYTGALQAYVDTPLTSRTMAIAAFAAKLNGTAKNGDGTYAGALFPVDNAGHVGWNDGTVFNPADTHTQAT